MAGARGRLTMEQRLYRLGTLVPPPTTGRARCARAADRGLLSAWMEVANPTSNAVYRSIGYRPDHGAKTWRLSSEA
jgi:hypothetical protein